jgi:hypothetical protein
MHVEEINVIGLQFLERCLERDTQRLCAVACVVGSLAWLGIIAGESSCEFRSDDHGVAVLAGCEPFSNPGFGFLVLVVVCAGNYVSRC